MRIIFFGTPSFALPSLKALIESGESVIAVVTQPDRVKGRGHKLSMPPVKEYALSLGIPVMQPSGIRSAEFIESIKVLEPDMIVVVAYGRIIPPQLIHLPPYGCINVHASLLPEYRGAAPIQWSIVKGETVTGITTMLMDEGLDTGDMLLQEETSILPEDDSVTLGERLSSMGGPLLVRTIEALKNGSVKPVPQEGESTYAPIIKKEDGKIDWNSPAVDISNLVRGMHPWPGAFCFLNNERITITKARAAGGRSSVDPGTISGISNDGMLVSIGDGMLLIVEVKPDGKSAMSGNAFANGRRLKEGMKFDA